MPIPTPLQPDPVVTTSQPSLVASASASPLVPPLASNVLVDPSLSGSSLAIPYIPLDWGPLPPSYTVVRVDDRLFAVGPDPSDSTEFRQDSNVLVREVILEDGIPGYQCKAKLVAEDSVSPPKATLDSALEALSVLLRQPQLRPAEGVEVTLYNSRLALAFPEGMPLPPESLEALAGIPAAVAKAAEGEISTKEPGPSFPVQLPGHLRQVSDLLWPNECEVQHFPSRISHPDDEFSNAESLAREQLAHSVTVASSLYLYGGVLSRLSECVLTLPQEILKDIMKELETIAAGLATAASSTIQSAVSSWAEARVAARKDALKGLPQHVQHELLVADPLAPHLFDTEHTNEVLARQPQIIQARADSPPPPQAQG